MHGPAEGSLEAPLSVLADLQRKGLVRHIGLSNVTSTQIAEGRKICEIVLRAELLQPGTPADGTAYVPFFPLGGFNTLLWTVLSEVAARVDATPMQVALAWLIRRAPNILLIPGTSSLTRLRENLTSAELNLPDDVITALSGIGCPSGRHAAGQ